MAKELGLKSRVFETDAKILADACKGVQGRAYFHTIVLDCLELFKQFDNVLVEFVSRSANEVAHKLARAAHSLSGIEEWVGTAPDFVSHVLINQNKSALNVTGGIKCGW